MTREVCPCCNRPLPFKRSEPTARELDVLNAWWGTKNLRIAAEQCGLTYQRAKNLMARCRSRSGVRSNDELLVIHLDALRSRLAAGTSQNIDRSAA